MDPIDSIIRRALDEDLGPGDRTTEALVPPDLYGRARILAKEACVLCGIDVSRRTFQAVDPTIEFAKLCDDGSSIKKGQTLAEISGKVAGLLSAERTALNFLQRLSGISTLTRQFVDAVKAYPVKVLDTRKTAPGLRILEKYAVRCGGGSNHRLGAYDGILIKDNHITACGGIAEAIKRGKARAPHTLRIEVEATSIEEVEEAMEAGAEAILLDNMSPDSIEAAVSLVSGKCFLEASGGIGLENIEEVAKTGIRAVSIGALTHSARAIDISMQFLP